MGFPATNNTVPEALARIRREAAALKHQAAGWHAKMLAGTVTVENLGSMIDTLRNIDGIFQAAVDTYGKDELGAVATSYLGSDPTADFDAMRAAMEAARVAIRDTVPTHNGQVLSYDQDSETGEQTSVTMSAADTMAAQAALQALIDAID